MNKIKIAIKKKLPSVLFLLHIIVAFHIRAGNTQRTYFVPIRFVLLRFTCTKNQPPIRALVVLCDSTQFMCPIKVLSTTVLHAKTRACEREKPIDPFTCHTTHTQQLVSKVRCPSLFHSRNGKNQPFPFFFSSIESMLLDAKNSRHYCTGGQSGNVELKIIVDLEKIIGATILFHYYLNIRI